MADITLTLKKKGGAIVEDGWISTEELTLLKRRALTLGSWTQLHSPPLKGAVWNASNAKCGNTCP